MDKTAEELIKIVESGQEGGTEVPSSSTRISKYKTNVMKFIKEKGIKPGSARVPVHKLVYEYYKWTNKCNYNRASNVELGRIMSTMFETGRTGTTRYYLLEPFCDLSKESLQQSKKYYQAQHLTRKRNAKKRKEEEISERKDQVS